MIYSIRIANKDIQDAYDIDFISKNVIMVKKYTSVEFYAF